ncbi:MAG TPA: alpha/beta hydrolase [Candidatus Babeliales bacterium]|jgi:pimeloyl-ACP methyl ester carboxylesterase|nr:alpha/beta hydrolase [Candidatus Babeliales bacterium]
MSPIIHTIFILIHGTWGADSSWYKPDGDFFEALNAKCTVQHAMVIPFRWSGYNNDVARKQAAQDLAALVKRYDAATRICMVGHSHGGNVAILASHICAQNSDRHRSIDALYLLGTPAGSSYKPNMDVINYVYNLISFEDMVQPVIGFFGREQPHHERIANMRITIHNKEPNHTDLHHPIVGSWLVYLDTILHTHTKEDSFIHFTYQKPGTIHFYSNQAPIYEIDTKWEQRIARDTYINTVMLNSISRNKKISAIRPSII